MHTHPSIYPGISMIPKRCTLAHAYYTDRRSCIALILFGVPVPTGTSNAWLVRFYLRTPVKGSIGSNRFACLDSMIPCSIFPVAASSRVFRTRLTPPNRLSCAQDSHRQVMRRAARSVSHSAWLLHHRSERWTPLSCILCHSVDRRHAVGVFSNRHPAFSADKLHDHGRPLALGRP